MKPLPLLLLCALLPACLILAGLDFSPAESSSMEQERAVSFLPVFSSQIGALPSFQGLDGQKCKQILKRTARRMGWENPVIYVQEDFDADGQVDCQMSVPGTQNGVLVQYDVSILTHQGGWCDDCAYYCERPGNVNDCKCRDIQGLPVRVSGVADNQGRFLSMCDHYCDVMFKVHTIGEDNLDVDPIPVAKALYFSALEMNCCQAGEALPPEDSGNNPAPPVDGGDQPPDSGLPPSSGGEPGGSPIRTSTAATNPIVPLSGAVIGTVAGWILSVLVTNWNTIGSLLSRPASTPPAGPVLRRAIDWDEWEREYSYRPEDLPPAIVEPDPKELRRIKISAEDAKAEVVSFYSNEITPEGLERVEKAKVTYLNEKDYVKRYLEANGPEDKDVDWASAFTDPVSGAITICKPRAINYTEAHEMLHVASNRRLGELSNKALDEGFTEYFTLKITNQRKIPRITEYQLKGMTDVVEQIAREHGEELVKKAYFKSGDEGFHEMRQVVDSRLGPGAFQKAVQLIGSDDPVQRVKALHLLQGRKPAPK